MKFFNIAAAVLALALSGSVSAHTSLKLSTPADGAMLMQSPEQLSLTFSGKVRLAKVQINDANNQAVNFNFKPSATPETDFSWALPKLDAGQYSVKWLVMGGDGHKMSGTFDFMLHSSDAHSMQQKPDSSSHHKH